MHRQISWASSDMQYACLLGSNCIECWQAAKRGLRRECKEEASALDASSRKDRFLAGTLELDEQVSRNGQLAAVKIRRVAAKSGVGGAVIANFRAEFEPLGRMIVKSDGGFVVAG